MSLRLYVNCVKFRGIICVRAFRTCSSSFRRNMEGYVITDSGKRRPIVSPLKGSPPKKMPFTGITPLKDINYEPKERQPFKVSIEGNIGAGKSTLIKFFEGVEGVETYAEPINWWRDVQGYNLLELLYKDIKQWIYTFQSYVLLTRLKIQTSSPEKADTNVQMFERSVQNNRYCFLEAVHESGTLNSTDYTILDKWFRWIRENVDINLDLIVYLRTSPEVVYERMKARGRPEEANVSLEYLTQLHKSHEKWLMSNNERYNSVPVLILDANLPIEELKLQYEKHKDEILGRKKEMSEKDESNDATKEIPKKKLDF